MAPMAILEPGENFHKKLIIADDLDSCWYMCLAVHLLLLFFGFFSFNGGLPKRKRGEGPFGPFWAHFGPPFRCTGPHFFGPIVVSCHWGFPPKKTKLTKLTPLSRFLLFYQNKNHTAVDSRPERARFGGGAIGAIGAIDSSLARPSITK